MRDGGSRRAASGLVDVRGPASGTVVHATTLGLHLRYACISFESNRAGCLVRDVKRLRWGLWCLLLGCAVAAGACSVGRLTDDSGPSDDTLDMNEAAYKPDILAMLRIYINDPTQMRDAAISQPMGRTQRFRVCLQLNARNRGGEYAG